MNVRDGTQERTLDPPEPTARDLDDAADYRAEIRERAIDEWQTANSRAIDWLLEQYELRDLIEPLMRASIAALPTELFRAVRAARRDYVTHRMDTTS